MRSMTARRIGSGIVLYAFWSPAAFGQSVLWELLGSAPGDGFGSRLESGDVNCDGVADLVVGSPGYAIGSLGSAGRVQVFSGLDGSLLHTLTHASPNANMGFGSALAVVGDLDADGCADFAVGAPGTGWPAPGWFPYGSVTVFSGATGFVLFYFTGQPPEYHYGTRLATLGDVDGDGVPDFAVTSFLPGVGQVQIRSGGTGFALANFPGSSTYGSALAGPGDVDGDGTVDIAIGALGSPMSGILGAVHVYAAATGAPIFSAFEPANAPGFGYPLARVGDVDADGFADLAVGNYGNPALLLPPLSGARVLAGPSGGLIWTVPQLHAGDLTGWGLAGPRDMDGDGFDDLLVGSPGYGIYPTYWGMVRAISGQTGTALSQVTGWAQSFFGKSTTGIADITGDDFPDFAVGSDWVLGFNCGPTPGGGTACSGKVRVYSGAPPGVTSFGSGCSASGGPPPRIGATWKPALGSTWSVNLSRTQTGLPTLLILGVDNSQWSGIPLPLDLTFLGLPGCQLLASLDVVIPVVTTGSPLAGGHASIPFAIPAAPSLVGATVYAQFYVAGPGPSGFPGSMTRGLQATVQP